jgi:hypothetical protein
MLTLSDTYDPNTRIDQITGKCARTVEWISLINTASRRLANRGDWNNTVVPIYICVMNGCVVWPRYVKQIRRINVCSHAIPIHNSWYKFLSAYQSDCGWQGWRGAEVGFSFDGQTAVVQDVMGDGRYIRAYARNAVDFGKTLTIFGIDNDGQPLAHKDADGNWVPGAVITLADPYGSTNTYVRRIDYVTKDVTQQIVDVFAYNASTDLLEEVAHYDPGEVTPTYTKSKLNMAWPTCCTGTVTPNCCGTRRGILAMVKLRYIPAAFDTDLILIDNVDALRKMIMSIKAEEAGDFTARQQWEADAVHEMNRDLEDNSPDENFSVADNTIGSRVRCNQVF